MVGAHALVAKLQTMLSLFIITLRAYRSIRPWTVRSPRTAVFASDTSASHDSGDAIFSGGRRCFCHRLHVCSKRTIIFTLLRAHSSSTPCFKATSETSDTAMPKRLWITHSLKHGDQVPTTKKILVRTPDLASALCIVPNHIYSIYPERTGPLIEHRDGRRLHSGLRSCSRSRPNRGPAGAFKIVFDNRANIRGIRGHMVG